MMFLRDSKPLLDPRNYNAMVKTASNKGPDFHDQYVDETEVSAELSKYNASHAGATFYLTDELFDFCNKEGTTTAIQHRWYWTI